MFDNTYVLIFQSQLESFLVGHVLPTLHAPEGYRRARAYRLLEKLSEAKFNDQNIFAQVVDEVRKAACFDSELPVRAFAALCLSELVRCQETGELSVIILFIRDVYSSWYSGFMFIKKFV